MRRVSSSHCARLGIAGALARIACAACAALSTAVFAASGCAPESSREGDPDRPDEELARAEQALEPVPPWSETGGMSVARHGLTATTLLDGRVLVVGGQRTGAVDTGDVFFETAEIWKALPGQFKIVVAQMSQKRAYHTAVRLADGRVLVAGGIGGGPTSEVFDPQKSKWSAPVGLLHAHGVGSTLVLLADGRALLAGGESSGAAEIFDPQSGAWTDTAPLTTPRHHHAATLLKDGRVLVTGGQTYDATPLVTARAEIYDPKSGAWKVVKKMVGPRLLHGAARLANGQVLVVGGSTDAVPATDAVELYDPVKNTWTTVAPLATGRVLHTTAMLDNGAVLVTGGIDAIGSVLRSTELFDPDAQRWIFAGQLHHGRLAHAVTPIAGSGALAAGGEDQSTAELYQSAANGLPCEVGRQCASGFCVDAVCCNTSCDGHCVTCALPGAEGDCSIAAPGTDPHLDCGQGAPCDDVCGEGGACTDRVGEVCVAAACVDDGVHAIVQATCKAPGAACDSVRVDCTPYRCGASSGSGGPGCLAKCASLDDCAAGYACDPEGTCRLRPDVAGVDPEACSMGVGSSSSGIGSSSSRTGSSSSGGGSSSTGGLWIMVIALAAAAGRARSSARSGAKRRAS